MFRHRCCKFLNVPVPLTPFSYSFCISSSFVYFHLIILFKITISFHLASLSTVSIQNGSSSVEENTVICTLPSFSLWLNGPSYPSTCLIGEGNSLLCFPPYPFKTLFFWTYMNARPHGCTGTYINKTLLTNYRHIKLTARQSHLFQFINKNYIHNKLLHPSLNISKNKKKIVIFPNNRSLIRVLAHHAPVHLRIHKTELIPFSCYKMHYTMATRYGKLFPMPALIILYLCGI